MLLQKVALRSVMIWRDRGYTCKKVNRTRKTSIKKYIDLYAGSTFLITSQHAEILNISFVTLTFGFGIPILFPIACLAYFCLYLTERISLFYFYQKPPMYGLELNKTVLRYLMFAPLFYFAFGYWMCSSRQLLSNDFLKPSPFSSSTQLTQHTLHHINLENPSWPLLLAFLLFIFVRLFLTPIRVMLEGAFPKAMIDTKFEFEQDIDSYYNSLAAVDRYFAYLEERNNRDFAPALKILTDWQYRMLKRTPFSGGKTMLGIPSYDILANPEYQRKFQYIPATVTHRNEVIFDSDSEEGNDEAQVNLIRMALNIGFYHPNFAKTLRFEKDACLTKTQQRNNQELIKRKTAQVTVRNFDAAVEEP